MTCVDMFPVSMPYGWSAAKAEKALENKAPDLYKEFCEARPIFFRLLINFHRQSRTSSTELTLATMDRHAEQGFRSISRELSIVSPGGNVPYLRPSGPPNHHRRGLVPHECDGFRSSA